MDVLDAQERWLAPWPPSKDYAQQKLVICNCLKQKFVL
jgi:hypothetical protein